MIVTGVVRALTVGLAHSWDLHALITPVIFVATLCSGVCCCPWFTDEETEAQRVGHSPEVSQPGGDSLVPELGS